MTTTPSGREKRPLQSPGTPSPVHKQSKMAEQDANTSEFQSFSSSSKQSQDERIDKMMEILLSVKKGQESLQKTFDSKIERLRRDVLSTIDDKIKAVKVDVDLQFASLDNRIHELERAMNSFSTDGMPMSDHTVNNCDVTVIVSNLRQRPGEIPLQAAKELIRALGNDVFENTVITDAKRCNERNRGTPPVLKIAFENVEQKVNVLRAKQELKQSLFYKKVYIRGSKTHTERILELNAKTLLSELPNGNQYRVTANGRIVKKQAAMGTSPIREPPGASQSAEARTDDA